MWFGLLGPLTVLNAAGAPLAVGSAKVRSLLVVLLLQPNQLVSQDYLLDALWGSHPPATANASLHNTVGLLRRGLGVEGPSRLTTVPTGYRFGLADGELDTDVFSHHLATARAAHPRQDWRVLAVETATALTLWRGAPLADFPVLAEKARPRVQQLQEARLQLLEWRFNAELELGRHQGLVSELVALVAQHPLREAFHRQLMLALSQCQQQAEALAVYHRLRRDLIDELGVEPGPAIRRVYQEILGEPVAEAKPERNDLPRACADFVGREDELARLLAGDAVSAIDGMAGVGKTALAIHAAGLLAASYSDAQLYIDLRGFTPNAGPLDPGVALGSLLLAIGMRQDRIPDSVADRSALWRAELARRRTVVVLDNAFSERQVTPLLAGTAQCRMLITSRRRLLDLDVDSHLSLDILTPPQATALFTAIVGGDRVSGYDTPVAEVLRLCGYLPLAIRVAATRLDHSPVWDVEHLARRLRAGSGHGGIAAALDASIDQLDPTLRAVFALVGQLPGETFDAYAIAALTGHSTDAAERHLEALTDVHLVIQRSVHRYDLHDLTRDHLRGRERDEQADRRLFDYYWLCVAKAVRLIDPFPNRGEVAVPAGRSPAVLPPMDSVAAATAWLRAEIGNVLVLGRVALAAGRPAATMTLFRAVNPFFYLGGHASEWISLGEIALAAAEVTGQPGDRIWAHMTIGSAQRANGEPMRSLAQFGEALALADVHGPVLAKAFALNGMATVRADLWHLEEALAGYLAAAAAFAESDVTATLNPAHVNVTVILHRLGRNEEALHYGRLAVAAHLESDNHGALIAAQINLADVHLDLGDLDVAAGLYTRSMRAARERGIPEAEASAANGLAVVAREAGDLDAALAHHALVTLLVAGTEGHARLADFLLDRADTHRARGHRFRALADYEQALGIARRRGNPQAQELARAGIAELRI
ncbi:MAG: BTAD domain-containing putative transcriptional regulator [Umezawaea sp.]